MKILVIDDDPFSVALLERQISSLVKDADIITFSSAAESLSMLERNTIDPFLVFCDLQMPELDGVEFLRELNKLSFRGGVVLVTGEDVRILKTAEKLARIYNLNILGALPKPIQRDQLKLILSINQCDTTARNPRSSKKYSADELGYAMANGHIVNYYQPKISLDTRAVVGVEALVRWLHPSDGMIFPDSFVSTAENSNLIDDLTSVVLMGAIKQARIWQDMGLNLKASVNISMDNLHSLDFTEYVNGMLDKHGVNPSLLILEVTETRLMKDPLSALDILTRLRLKGVTLSIDDFGTGNSSLVQLRDLPFNELKIDQGFVRGAYKDDSLRAIFEGSLKMASQMNMISVAEGVEDRNDWEFVSAMGCDIAQGYFIAKPMPASDISRFIKDWGHHPTDNSEETHVE